MIQLSPQDVSMRKIHPIAIFLFFDFLMFLKGKLYLAIGVYKFLLPVKYSALNKIKQDIKKDESDLVQKGHAIINILSVTENSVLFLFNVLVKRSVPRRRERQFRCSTIHVIDG